MDDDGRDGLSHYEAALLAESLDWIRREPGWFDQAVGGRVADLRRRLDRVLASHTVRRALDRIGERVLASLEDLVVADTLAVLPPHVGGDRESRLRRLEREAEDLRQRTIAAATAQGSLAGVASVTPVTAAFTLVPDVVSALALGVRAAARHLVLYGLVTDPTTATEDAVRLLAAATETDPVARQATILAIAGAHAGGAHAPADDLPSLVIQQTGTRTVRETIEHVARRVIGRRSLRLVPAIGIAASGVTSAWLGARVADAGRHTGRIGFLVREGGVDLAELPAVQPIGAIGGATGPATGQ